MQEWKTLARQTVYQPDGGRFLTLENHAVGLPNGRRINNWPWVITPDFVNVVAVTEADDFLCFNQTKYATGQTLAIVGGYIDEDEEPLAAAQRELLEETGYAASGWRALGSFAVDANRGCGTGHLFLATGARHQQPIDADDLEEQELIRLSRTQIEAELRAGSIKVLSWAAAIALALPLLDEERNK